MSRHYVRGGLMFVVVALGAALCEEAQAAPAAGIDPAYVPADAFGVLVTYPQKILADKRAAFLPTEVITAASMKEFGFDAADIEQVVVVIESPFSGRPHDPGVILRLAKPVAAEKVFPGLMRGATPAQADGKPYLKNINEWNPSLCVLDGKTVLLADEPALLKMLAAKPSDASPLHQKLKTADGTAAAVGVFSIDAVREPLKQLTANPPPLPPPLADLLTLPEVTSAVEFRIYLQPTLKVTAIAHATNAAAAPDIQKKLTAALQFGQQMAQAQIAQQFGRSQDPIDQATGQYLERVLKVVAEGIKVQQAGERVGIAIEPRLEIALAKSPATAVDLSFVPGDAMAAAYAFPERVFKAQGLELLPREIITAAGQRELGFDPVNLAQVTVILAEPPLQPPPKAGLVLRFSQPVAADQVFAQVTAGGATGQANGKTYRKPQNPRMPCVCIHDEKTVLVADEETLLKMLAAKPSETSVLHQKLRGADMSALAVGVIDLNPVREPIKQILANAPQLPPALAGLTALPELTSAVEVRLQTTPKPGYTVVLYGKDAAAGPDIEAKIKAALKFAQEMAMAQATQAVGPIRANDPIQEAFGRYMQRMTKMSFDGITVQGTGEKVAVIVEPPLEVAGVGTMAALLMPAISQVRMAAHRAQSQSNVHNFAIGMKNYEAGANRMPARAIFSKEGKPLLSWRVLLLPKFEEGALYEKFHLDEPWDSEHNKQFIAQMPAIYKSPGNSAEDGKTRYVVPTGKGLLFDGEKGIAGKDFTDGLSNTIMLVEVGGDKSVIWTKPDDMEVDLDKPWDGFGRPDSPAGFIVGFADGSVRMVLPSLDAKMLRAFFTRSGGEEVGDGDLRD